MDQTFAQLIDSGQTAPAEVRADQYREVHRPLLSQTEFTSCRITNKRLSLDTNKSFEKRQRDQLIRMLKAWASWSNDRKTIGREMGLGYELPKIEQHAPDGYDAPDYAVYAESELEWLDRVILELEPQDKLIVKFEFVEKTRNKAKYWAKRCGAKAFKTYYNRRNRLYEDLINIIILKYSAKLQESS